MRSYVGGNTCGNTNKVQACAGILCVSSVIVGLRKGVHVASSEDYLAYVLDLLGEVPDASHRKMMGEYVLYAHGKVFGESTTTASW